MQIASDAASDYHSVSDVETGVDIAVTGDKLVLDGIWSDRALPDSAELVVRVSNREVMNVPITYLIQKDHRLWEIPFAEFAPAGLPCTTDGSSVRYNVQVTNGVPGTKLYYRQVYMPEPQRRVRTVFPVMRHILPEFNSNDAQTAMLPPGEYTGFLIHRSISGYIKITFDIGSLKVFEIDYSQIMLYGKARGDYTYFAARFTADFETKLSINMPVMLYASMCTYISQCGLISPITRPSTRITLL